MKHHGYNARDLRRVIILKCQTNCATDNLWDCVEHYLTWNPLKSVRVDQVSSALSHISVTTAYYELFQYKDFLLVHKVCIQEIILFYWNQLNREYVSISNLGRVYPSTLLGLTFLMWKSITASYSISEQHENPWLSSRMWPDIHAGRHWHVAVPANSPVDA